MDEWMLLTSGEAAHRQQAQRALFQASQSQRHPGLARRFRTALATVLALLATRLDPALSLAQREALAQPVAASN